MTYQGKIGGMSMSLAGFLREKVGWDYDDVLNIERVLQQKYEIINYIDRGLDRGVWREKVLLNSEGQFRADALKFLPYIDFNLTFNPVMAEMGYRLIKRAEVGEHHSRDALWIVIENNVYDLTAYLNEHPGGEEVLLEQAGKDGSEAFEDVGHSADAKELMLRYKIGSIVEHERIEPKKKVEKSSCTLCSVIGDMLKAVIVPVAIGVAVTCLYSIYRQHKST